MARRKDSGIPMISGLPWQAGIMLGVTGYIAVRYGLGWCMSTFGGPESQALGSALTDGAYAPIAWLLLGACWVAALVSFLDNRRRKHLLGAQNGLTALSAMDWREFEMLIRRAFRLQGYSVREAGLVDTDSGVDLILCKDGQTTLVQCRQWRTRLVDVKLVREMYGLQVHHHADAVKIIAIGNYTDDAQRFVNGKPIELICGSALLAMVRENPQPASIL
ncbi:restriction endonuclease [Dyella caseinilytica]|nr:restriction endonuclease [Dyella caseinilytica]